MATRVRVRPTTRRRSSTASTSGTCGRRRTCASHTSVTTQADDPNTWLPLAALEAAAADGRVGALAERLIGLPTDRSQRATLERDAPDVLAACRRMEIDAALLVPT
jgi:hypothetical protein